MRGLTILIILPLLFGFCVNQALAEQVTPMFSLDYLNNQGAPTEPTPTTTLLISWQGHSSVPRWFTGRVLPTAGEELLLGVTGLQEGRSINMAEYRITWRAGNQIIGQGIGLTSLRYTLSEYVSGALEVSVRVERVEEKRRTLIARALIEIPVGEPQIVLSIPYPQRIVPQDEMIAQALPFFFPARAIDTLSYAWRVQFTTLSNEQALGNIMSTSFDGPGKSVPVIVTATPSNQSSPSYRAINYITVR